MALHRYATVVALLLAWGPSPGRAQATTLHRINEFMSYDPAARTVLLKITAALGTAHEGLNFNGGADGNQTITVPLGWTVKMEVSNRDSGPHSVTIVRESRAVPNAPEAADIIHAHTSRVATGLAAGGHEGVTFAATPEGAYLLTCAVPGHGPRGMYLHFIVSAAAQVPAYR
ncbi:MAG: hypothetical protein NVS1B4_06350 [Gemmatimonadaceae bacterium]